MADFHVAAVHPPIKPMVFELDIDFPPPPLILLLNPSQLEFKYSSKLQETKGRFGNDRRDTGYIMQVAHDELDVISAECRSAQFYDDGGLTYKNSHRSIAYENFAQLLAIYRCNGMNYTRQGTTQGASLIQSVGKVLIIYDGSIYKGFFDSFSTSSTQEVPFWIGFNFEFKVIETTTISGMMSPTVRNILDEHNPFFTRL
jgi:hypothetical protein